MENNGLAPNGTLEERLLIRELVENWVLFRDAGDWERFRSLWHEDGRMMATWCQADVDGFIKASRQGAAKGVSILHFLGGSSIEIIGDRAVAQTKMTISQRAAVEGVVVDVVCTGRFYDFLERRRDKWGMVLRQPSTKRIEWIRWIRPLRLRWTPLSSLDSRKATDTLRTCRRALAMTSKRTCRDSRAPRLKPCMFVAKPG
ncbi:MAG: nuclear transport factor 2 family protein [Steroidobacteraceae bacterium]